jgi:hypothetical protein
LRNGIDAETAKLEFMATAFLLTNCKTENFWNFTGIAKTKQNWNLETFRRNLLGLKKSDGKD